MFSIEAWVLLDSGYCIRVSEPILVSLYFWPRILQFSNDNKTLSESTGSESYRNHKSEASDIVMSKKRKTFSPKCVSLTANLCKIRQVQRFLLMLFHTSQSCKKNPEDPPHEMYLFNV